MNFYTSDYHFNHTKIIEHCYRPFKTVAAMNECIVKNHNSRVKANDTVFHIGDLKWKGNVNEWLSRLNGKKILIKGNHDNRTTTIIRSLVIEYGGKLINLVHDSEFVDMRCEINLVGHHHGDWKFKRFVKQNSITVAINVGIDQWNLMPITMQEIMKYYKEVVIRKGGRP